MSSRMHKSHGISFTTGYSARIFPEPIAEGGREFVAWNEAHGIHQGVSQPTHGIGGCNFLFLSRRSDI